MDGHLTMVDIISIRQPTRQLSQPARTSHPATFRPFPDFAWAQSPCGADTPRLTLGVP